MKYPGAGTSTTLFCEQVSTVTSLFEQWNDCEKSVVLYALLKRVPFANLKFLQFSVEHNLKQNYNTQSKFYALEQNANNAIFLTKLLQKYKSLKKTADVRLFGANGQTTNTNVYLDGKQEKKEDILNDILTYLLLLKPDNDDAKAVYMSIIPCAIDDSTRNLVPTELVQQILSYLLIHPALTNEDRRSLSQWLRHLEDHISLSYVPQTAKTKSVAFQNDLTATSTSPYLTSTSSLSSTSWQTVAPPPTLPSTTAPGKPTAAATSTSKDSLWDLHSIQMTQDFCDEIKDKEFLTQTGSGGTGGSYLNKSTSQSSQSSGPASVPQTTLQPATGTSSGSATSPSSSSVQLFDTSEDHHISFSKNGTEVLDFDCDDYNNSKSNTQIAFDSTTMSDFLTVPNYLMLENNMMTKTRRSNSLTTTPVTATTTTALGGGQQQMQQQQTHQLLGGDCYSSSSAENLANLTAAQQKPRSFSLSMASPRSSLTSSGSETRLDEFCNSNINTIKQNHMKNGGLNGANLGLTGGGSTNNIGMSGIGQWLKSLRLHKYIWLFSNLTYDQMLDINEEYLQSLGVTKGARHKLVICIQKLRERCQCLVQMEKELLTKQKPLNSVLEEMTNIVLTPMRPYDRFKKDDVAGQFMQMIECVSMTIMKNPICTPTDEECINMFLWILEKALHNDAFLAQTNQLKEHKYKVSKIKMQFTPKSHYTKNPNVNGNISKSRWTSNTKHKSDGQPMNNNNNNNNNSTNNNLIKIHRKNSNVMPPPHFPTAMLHMQQQQQQQQQQNQQSQPYGPQQSNSYNSKSSSYPNFICSTNSSNMMMNSFKQHPQQQPPNSGLQQPTQLQQQQQQSHQPQQQQGTHYANGTPYHRHSLNNLITINTNNPSFLSALSNPPPSLQASTAGIGAGTTAVPPPLNNRENNKNNLNMDILAELSNGAANSGGTVVNGLVGEQPQQSAGRSGSSSKPSIGDINSRLEFLCLQMTEQAIN